MRVDEKYGAYYRNWLPTAYADTKVPLPEGLCRIHCQAESMIRVCRSGGLKGNPSDLWPIFMFWRLQERVESVLERMEAVVGTKVLCDTDWSTVGEGATVVVHEPGKDSWQGRYVGSATSNLPQLKHCIRVQNGDKKPKHVDPAHCRLVETSA